ncbi:MAG: putative 3-deoxy-D-manno-octulosonate 8-phosphate phosphatase [Rhodospirillales bacterium]|jgi:3-deoxy-D-manno-octulosonate 8-phosphate phosphatase (KDO 8-P phosphatase)|nr:putative 3-deoxy-D-manno-octulosonate 8-phosphate phosphatase [Rhodospirillales bacterium]
MSTRIPKDLRARLKRLKLLSLDTDGVLTDGGVYFTDSGEEMRKFNIKDGLGMQRVQRTGVMILMMTGSIAPAIEHRARALGVDRVYLDTRDKLARLVEVCDELKIDLGEVAHVGDDLTDLKLFEVVGCPITVADGVAEVRALAHYVTERRGGDAAVREICDLIVEAKAEA